MKILIFPLLIISQIIFSQAGFLKLGNNINGEAVGDESGISVGINSFGNRIAIGGYKNDGNGSNSGHVRIYEDIGGNWIQIGTDIDGETMSDKLGKSVDMNSLGDRVVVGAWFAASASLPIGSGQISCYEFTNGSWNQLGNYINGEATFDYFGISSAINASGNIIAGGAYHNDGVNGYNSGHVRVYEYIAGVWTQLGNDIDGGATVTSLGNTLTEGTGTIEYDYAGNQTVLSETYYNLTINNSTGVKTAGGALDIDGDLTIYNSSSTVETLSSCDSLTWIDGVTYTSSNNSAIYNSTSSFGCDSMIILNLTINDFQTNFSESSNSFLAPPFSVYFSNNTPDLSNYSFTWDFGDGTVVQDNSDSVFYEYLYNGNYDVTLVVEDIVNGCGFDTLKKTGIISCTGGPNLSIIENHQSIVLFPNPTKENITVSIGNYHGFIKTEVYDLLGNKLTSFENNTISLKDFGNGVYLLKIYFGEKMQEIKIIKEE